MNLKKKILFAVGGTGGHLFPAQALAEELLEKDASIDILFAGAHLNTNHFLDKTRFRFQEVISATPFRSNPFRACFVLWKGVKESLALLNEEKPDLIVGFGSYHSFPLLVAAKLRGISFVLFEADLLPGKVNRLFSRYALFTAVPFPHSVNHLKGKLIPVVMPSKHGFIFDTLTKENARKFLGLREQCFTLLVFGGSQGAQRINQQLLAVLPQFWRCHFSIQLIHITGNEEAASAVRKLCDQLDITCYVKEFEPHMGYLWKAATLFMGRAGASTLSEMIRFEVPGILIPYPHGSDEHQHINAQFLENEVKGGVCLMEDEITEDKLIDLMGLCEKKIDVFKESIQNYKGHQKKETLGQVIYETFC